jgi:hypothetical protein
MNLVDILFGGRSERLDEVFEPPLGVDLHPIRPKPNQPSVRARLAEADCALSTEQGKLTARGGLDYIVTYDLDDHAVVSAEIFERTYEPLGGGLYRKRSDIILRYFTLDHPVLVHTLEGDQKAAAGDWIVQGVTGELWPVPREKALKKYDPA